MNRMMLAETVRFRGHDDDQMEAYLARPLSDSDKPGVIVIHHMPGWDEPSLEITRRFAHHGYVAICPNLYSRETAAGSTPQQAAEVARDRGGVPDERLVGDVRAAAQVLREMPDSNGKVGVIGYCSGGRQAFIAAAQANVEAAVDCYGGRVVAGPDQLTEARPVAPIDMAQDISCPILCLFGTEDSNPSPEHAEIIEQALKKFHKEYELHSYEGAGHGFFSTEPAGGVFNADAAHDGWERVFSFFGRHLT